MAQKFDWDEDKYLLNLQKHKVRFEYASRIFLDPLRIDCEDTRRDYKEERRIVVGYIDQRLYVVVYTQRDEVIRLISARKANDREAKRHHSALHAGPE